MGVASNFKKWTMVSEAIGQYTPEHGLSQGPFKLYISTLIPRVPLGKPKIKSVSLNKSCFINASECKPTISSSIQEQNYLTVPMYHNRAFKESYFWHGDKMRVIFLNKNPNDCYVDDKLDNSVDCTDPTHPHLHIIQ